MNFNAPLLWPNGRPCSIQIHMLNVQAFQKMNFDLQDKIQYFEFLLLARQTRYPDIIFSLNYLVKCSTFDLTEPLSM